MRLIIAAVWLTLCAGSLAAQTAPEWTGERRDLDSGSERGSATIAVDQQSVALGEPFSVDIRFFNSSGGEEFYNPFLGGQTPLPARLAIFSSDHKYLGDLLERQEVSESNAQRRGLDVRPVALLRRLRREAHGRLCPRHDGGRLPSAAAGRILRPDDLLQGLPREEPGQARAQAARRRNEGVPAVREELRPRRAVPVECGEGPVHREVAPPSTIQGRLGRRQPADGAA